MEGGDQKVSEGTSDGRRTMGCYFGALTIENIGFVELLADDGSVEESDGEDRMDEADPRWLDSAGEEGDDDDDDEDEDDNDVVDDGIGADNGPAK